MLVSIADGLSLLGFCHAGSYSLLCSFVQHLKNLTSGEAHIYVAQSDYGPFFELVVSDLENAFGVQAEPRGGERFLSDWDSIYPFRYEYACFMSNIMLGSMLQHFFFFF